jgi:hypothetical protein
MISALKLNINSVQEFKMKYIRKHKERSQLNIYLPIILITHRCLIDHL